MHYFIFLTFVFSILLSSIILAQVTSCGVSGRSYPRIDTLCKLSAVSPGIETNLELFYPLSNITTNDTAALDLSGYGRNASIVGYSYNNINETLYNYARSGAHWINVSNPINFSNNFTIMLWARLESSESFGYLVGTSGFWGEVGFILETSGKITSRIGVNSTAYNSSSGFQSPGINQFHLLTLIKNGTYTQVYDNNVLGATNYWRYNPPKTNYIFFGGNPGDSTRAINGSILSIFAWSRPLTLNEINKIYNFTETFPAVVSIDINRSTGQINDYFYGVNTHGIWGSNESWIDIDGNGTSDTGLDTLSNYTWHREKLLGANIKFIRADMYLREKNTFRNTWINGSFTNAYNINRDINLVHWAYDNNIKIQYIASYMPGWNSNQTSDCALNYNSTCPPLNYTLWGESVTQFLDIVTLNGTYNNVEVEVWNEPDSSTFWLNNLTQNDSKRIPLYLNLYQTTYNAIKARYPNMKVGGPSYSSGTEKALGGLWMGAFMGNVSMDFFSYHTYRQSIWGDNISAPYQNYWDDLLVKQVSTIKNNCASYNIPCSNIQLGEWSDYNSNEKANVTNIYNMQLGLAYLAAIKYYPSMTLSLYQWADARNYSKSGTDQLWSMVSEPKLDGKLYVSYNITKQLSSNHKAGDLVLNSSSNNNNLFIAATKGPDHIGALTIANKDLNAYNVVLNNPLYFTNVTSDNGTIYYLNDGVIDMGVILPYEVKTFSYSYTDPPIDPTQAQLTCRFGLESIGSFMWWFMTFAIVIGIVIVCGLLFGLFGDISIDADNILDWVKGFGLSLIILAIMGYTVSKTVLGC